MRQLDAHLSRGRVFGCALALAAHCLLAFDNPGVGVGVSLLGQFFFLPWSIRHRVWDLVALDAFYVVINVARLLS